MVSLPHLFLDPPYAVWRYSRRYSLVRKRSVDADARPQARGFITEVTARLPCIWRRAIRWDFVLPHEFRVRALFPILCRGATFAASSSRLSNTVATPSRPWFIKTARRGNES